MNEEQKSELNEDIIEEVTQQNDEEVAENQNVDEVKSDGKFSKVNILNEVMDLVESIIVSVFTVLLIFTFLFKVATVDGASMENTLHEDDKLIVSHMFYEPEAGDIIILNSGLKDANLNRKKLVKRVIATEGQVVDIDFETGKVTVDGVELHEDYIKELIAHKPFNNAFDSYPVTVGEGKCFVMGDNRNNSLDSREIGLIPYEDVIGQVVFRIYPFSGIGTL